MGTRLLKDLLDCSLKKGNPLQVVHIGHRPSLFGGAVLADLGDCDVERGDCVVVVEHMEET